MISNSKEKSWILIEVKKQIKIEGLTKNNNAHNKRFPKIT
jgi:hypothetical protein